MGLIKLECPYCKKKVHVDTRELDDDAEIILCVHCGETIDLPQDD